MKRWQLGIILVVYLSLTLYRLRDLPGEWFGDISIVHEEVLDILKNPFDWKYNLSAGPLYHHWVALWASFLGTTYLTYKLVSVATGLAGIGLMYLLGKELFGRRVGVWTAAVAATSCWYLIWARLGSSPQILSPVLTAGTGYLLARADRTKRWLDWAGAALVAGLGWFSYPALFVLPFIPLCMAVVGRKSIKVFGILLVILLLMTAGFGQMVYRQPDLFTHGYIGEKVFQSANSVTGRLGQAGIHLVKTLGMFFFKGDHGFRVNVSDSPELDRVSGLLLLVGLVSLFRDKKWRRKWLWVGMPFFILLLPSIAPGIPEIEIPSAGRTFGMAPWVFLLVGLGMETVWRLCKPRWAVVGLILLLITGLNSQHYFGAYAWGLPEHNQAWGRDIAEYIDSLPASTAVKLTGCCWGDAGQPEPKGIYYVLKHQEGRENLVTEYPWVSECNQIETDKPTLLIFDPKALLLQEQFQKCFPQAEGEMHRDSLGKEMFSTLNISH